MQARLGLRAVFAMVAMAAVLGLSAPAAATAKHDSPYTYKQTFGSALRLVKVDLDMKVTETNADWGYILFVYESRESGKRQNRGALSFVELEDGTVRVSVQMPQMPSYHEQLIVDQLTRKLQDEHGAPPKRRKPEPKPEPEEDKPAQEDKPKDPAADQDKPKGPPRWQRPVRR